MVFPHRRALRARLRPFRYIDGIFLKGLAHVQVSGEEAWVTAGINPAFSTTRGKYDA